MVNLKANVIMYFCRILIVFIHRSKKGNKLFIFVCSRERIVNRLIIHMEITYDDLYFCVVVSAKCIDNNEYVLGLNYGIYARDDLCFC